MNYFIIVNGAQQGPYTVEQLRDMHISSDTLVWAEGMAQWTPAWQVEALRPLLYQQQQTVTPPPPPPLDAVQTGEVPPMGQPHKEMPRSPRFRWPYAIVGVIVLLMIIMAITNPSRNEHRAVVTEQLSKGISRAMTGGDTSLFGQGLGMFGKMISGPLVDGLLDNLLVYHNYLLFSTTTIDFGDGQSNTTSYGLFGKVFTVSEERMAQAISSAVNKEIHGQELSTESKLFDDNQAADARDGHSDEAQGDASAQNDSLSLSKQVTNAIVDQVGASVKRKVAESTDSVTSSGIGKIVDEVISWLKSNDAK